MKKIFFSILTLISITCYSQTSKNIVLKKGQTITAISTITSDADMGMGTMKNSSTITNKIMVVDENADNYILTNAITNMKIEIDGMGQNASFDSDKPEDKDSQIGEAVADKLNKPSNFTLNKKTGKATSTDKKDDAEESGSPMAMSTPGGNENQVLEDAFMIIPANNNVGDSWNESSTVKGITTKKTFTLKSMSKDMAVIEMNGTAEGTTEQEAQGMTMNVTLNSKISGQIVLNPSTGCITKTTVTSDVNSNIEVMGQQMPVTSKTSTITDYYIQ